MGVDVERLDNRRFQDLVDEAKQRINRHSPEWTNHNLSDPGVALVELFAWMTEMTLFQLNQVPQREMKVLLNSVGFEQFPAQAATADITFYLTSGYRREVVVDPGLRVAAPLDGQEIFETETELRIVQPDLASCRAESRDGALTPTPETRSRADGVTEIRFDTDLVCFDGLEVARGRWSRNLSQIEPIQRPTWTPPDRFTGDVVYFGFEGSLARAVVRIDFEVATVAGLGIDPASAPLIWESSTSTGWSRCEIHGMDRTGGLNESGTVDIQIGREHEPMILVGGQRELHWLRVRVDLVRRDALHVYQASPELRSVAFTTIGATTPAVNAVRQEDRIVGVSDGTPAQRVALDRPILGGAHQVDVRVGQGRWSAVDDFAEPDDHSRVFIVDEATGEIVFGPRLHQAVGEPRQHGAIPAEGETIYASYCTGGGHAGNLPAGRITSMQTAINGIGSATNLRPATGGVDRETLDEALDRAPTSVRAGDRAVTTADFERLVRDAARDLHTVACRASQLPGGHVRVLIVPSVSTVASEQTIDDYTLPDSLCRRISGHLEPRKLVGTSVELTTPFYLGVSVVVRVRRASSSESSHGLRDTLLRALYTYINPVHGGDTGDGLGFGETITTRRIEDQLSHLDGVDAIVDVALFEVDLRRGRRVSDATSRIQLPPDSMFLSYRHAVIFEGEQAP